MNTVRSCGCKGVRTCLKCEKEYKIDKQSLRAELQKLDAWSYCLLCKRLYPGWDTEQVAAEHPAHITLGRMYDLKFPGLIVEENFLTEPEADTLIKQLDALPWDASQSGRRKQNFGPKTNFKERKLKNGAFKGFPKCTEYIQKRLREREELSDFQAIEQCSLEYTPEKGSCIDPHVDDCWIWGERVLTVNCLGDTVLTFKPYVHKVPNKYNLDLVKDYEDQLIFPLAKERRMARYYDKVLRVPMPNLSLMTLLGPARYQFEHFILREDVKERRVCIAYREFTPMYIDGEESEKGDEVRKNAQLFWD